MAGYLRRPLRGLAFARADLLRRSWPRWTANVIFFGSDVAVSPRAT